MSTVASPKSNLICSWMKASVCKSTLAVASSISKILLFFKIARARQRSCFSPTDRFVPLSSSSKSRPTKCYSYLFKCFTKSHLEISLEKWSKTQTLVLFWTLIRPLSTTSALDWLFSLKFMLISPPGSFLRSLNQLVKRAPITNIRTEPFNSNHQNKTTKHEYENSNQKLQKSHRVVQQGQKRLYPVQLDRIWVCQEAPFCATQKIIPKTEINLFQYLGIFSSGRH